jgi:trigger factor
LKSTVERESPTRVNLTIEVPFNELEGPIAEAYKRISAKVNIPGFRKGKTPRQLIDQHVGRETVLEEAINAALPNIYASAMDENALHALSRPNLNVTDFVDGQKVVVSAQIDVRPDFELPDFATLTATVDDQLITDDQVAAQLEQLRGRFATLNPVERAASTGDVVTLDIQASADGEPLPEYSAKSLTYQIGSEGLVPGADEALAKANKGETKLLTFTPEAGPGAGKEIKLELQVNAVAERVLPEPNDEFAALASEFDTYQELESDIRSRLELIADMQRRSQGRALVLANLLEKVQVPVPEDILNREVEQALSRESNAQLDKQALTKEIRNTLVSNMVLDRVADEIKVQVTDRDVAAWLVSQAPRFGVSAEALAKALSESGEIRVAYSDIRRNKALEHIAKQAKVTTQSGSEINMAEPDSIAK